ncbi:probable LRR receptor-like serine/threonine-protein kinase At1g56130 [Morus notabilis]|uniref:probable LRR receptor-like serine/threonine-protein kinase At1g56130 n=1 Tax=Morus notabilis TaxID=981085 RepID=UPI000CED6C45|nr:probable LRR receptor-like serine/threonine-protein kinase At1g56130 [Morus notabilis]
MRTSWVKRPTFCNRIWWWSYILFYFSIFLVFSPQKCIAQNATTDPSEVRALNTIFRKWNVQANPMWNISGEPCTGSAVNNTIDVEQKDNNPSIKCNCTYDNNSTCHITHLRVQSLDAHGEIPEEITSLKYLTYFKIDLNYFTGTLPAFIGNLSALQILSVSHNDFYGTIPKEIGNLKNLIMIALGSNNFSGTLPPELGNLPNLELIYIDSCGLSGEIPPTFANLRSMRVLYTTDSPFSGKIPDFIGNWTNLTELRLQGNSFEGPIPSSFSQLTSLKSLRISDIYKGSSSLDFVRSLKKLKELILRNALVTGRISSYIEGLKSLETLDLSFNNLTGEIPSSLFTLSNLTCLFLGNNSLSGIIPSQWSDKLQNVDLSYNYLSGSLPPWVTSLSQLNLVANNFVFDSSNKSVIPSLDCLQRNFPCNRDAPLYANLSIKCGGPQVRGKTGIVYEAENLYLGPAKFYVIDERWAVSKVGLFADKTGKLDIEGTRAEVSGATENPELFHTARMCPGSLRYYGLGLVNGNYTITLHFAEIGFPNRNSQKWAGLARRIFDIYIQGSLEQKDFEIAKEAGGVERAIVKKFHVTVSENYLEIHLFWAGKGTCCIPEQGYYGPLIAAIHVASDFTPTFSGIRETTQGDNKTGLILGITVPVVFVCLLLLAAVFYMRRKSNNEDEEVILGLGPQQNMFSYTELRAATEDFNPSNKIGEGGFGHVYKGTLSDGRFVALKQLSVASHHGRSQFLSEIATISVVQHRNLVKLYGCCIEGNRRILVYEYLENKSLDRALFGKNDLHLDWPTRFNICAGTARGLAYLHEESRPRIVHRDIKASNILLDEVLCPKISDFGLAKLYDDNKTHVSTRVAGTIGYLAPEYALRGHLTEKADVFGFGVVALEIVSGRPNFCNSLDNEKIYLLEWAWTLYENDQSLELMDPTLSEFDENEAIRLIRVALLCTQASPWLRPPMSRVVGMLSGDIEIDTAKSKPSYLTDLDFKDTTTSVFSSDTADTSHSSSKQSSHLFSYST